MTPESLPPPAQFEPEAYLDAAAASLDLVIAADHRPGILQYLDFTARLAAFVAAFPLADEVEPAPVFTPGQGEG